MRKIEFDELQQMKRYKYGYQSFILLAVLIMLNSVLNTMGIVWEQYPTNTFILLLTCCVYFISRCIWGDALVGPKDTPVRMTARTGVLVIFSIVIAVVAFGYAVTNLKPPVGEEHGGGSMLFDYTLVMWVVIGVVWVMKRLRDRKAD